MSHNLPVAEFDGQFLHQLVYYTAVRQGQIGENWRRNLQEALINNHISPEDIERAVTGAASPPERPRPTHHKPSIPPEKVKDIPLDIQELRDLTDLAMHCKDKRRFQEAELVLTHALDLVDAYNAEGFAVVNKLLTECRVLMILSLVYEAVGRYEEAVQVVERELSLATTDSPDQHVREAARLMTGAAPMRQQHLRRLRLKNDKES